MKFISSALQRAGLRGTVSIVVTVLASVACSTSTPDDGESSPSAVRAGTYPAFPEVTLPQIASRGGPVLDKPVIVPIVFPGVDAREGEEFVRLLSTWSTSGSWRTAVSEYGVGETKVTPVVYAPKLPTQQKATDLTDAEIKAFLGEQGVLGPQTPTRNSLYALFFPKELVVRNVDGSEVCGDAGGGYHDAVTLGDGTPISYAVLRRCPFEVTDPKISHEDLMLNMGVLMGHEIVEAVTDPFISLDAAHVPGGPWGGFHDIANPDWAWQFMFAGEVADMCNSTGPLAGFAAKPADLGGFSIQKTWSNAEAKLLHDPCVPHEAAPYFLSATDLKDTITLGAAKSRVVRVPVGTTSKPVDVKLLSTAPTEAWAVRAETLGGYDINGKTLTRWAASTPGAAPRLSFAWDRQNGKNGDILKLSVTALPGAPSGITVFQVVSKLGNQEQYWIAAAYTGTDL